MLESQNLLDVESVLTRPTILRDPVNEDCHFRHGRIHSVQQAQFEWRCDLAEALRPVGLDLSVFNLFRACDDLPATRARLLS